MIEKGSVSQLALAERITAMPQAAMFASIQTVTLEEAASVPACDDAIFLVILELQAPFLYNLAPAQFDVLQKFFIRSREITWVNPYGGRQPARPEYAVLNGWARVIRNEYPDHRLSTIQLEASGDEISDSQIFWVYDVLRKNHIEQGVEVPREWELIEMDNALSIPRVVPNKQATSDIYVRSLAQQSGVVRIGDCPPMCLTIGAPGLLDTLHFVEDDVAAAPLGDDEVEIRTCAVGMNFKDCLIALGQVSGKRLGLECAGVVTRVGSSVDGFQPGDRALVGAAISTAARAKASSALKIPDSMSFSEAVSIPTQFGTAWEAVHERARLRKGETILIHAAAGGTGQAALQIAHYVGATVFRNGRIRGEEAAPDGRVLVSRKSASSTAATPTSLKG